MREFRHSGSEKTGTLTRHQSAGLGILADPDVRCCAPAEGEATSRAEIRAFLRSRSADRHQGQRCSVIHRRAYLDHSRHQDLRQERRALLKSFLSGLFTSTAYTRSLVMKDPLSAFQASRPSSQKSGFDPNDHSGKALINVLRKLPARRALPGAYTSPPQACRGRPSAWSSVPRVRALYRVDRWC